MSELRGHQNADLRKHMAAVYEAATAHMVRCPACQLWIWKGGRCRRCDDNEYAELRKLARIEYGRGNWHPRKKGRRGAWLNFLRRKKLKDCKASRLLFRARRKRTVGAARIPK